MRTFKWVPQEIEIEIKDEKTGEVKKEKKESPFEGSVEVEIPKYRQRLAYLKECNFQMGDDGGIDVGSSYESIIKLIDISEKHVKKVDLKRKDDGVAFDSFEMLEDDQEGSEVLGMIGNKILEGVKLGNG